MSAGTPERGAPTEVVLGDQPQDTLADAILDERSDLADAILDPRGDHERHEREREARILRARLSIEPSGDDWGWYLHNVNAGMCTCIKCSWSPERRRSL